MSIFTRALRVMEALAASNASSSFSSSSPPSAPLGAYNIDPASVSVSGLSSGASFSVQLGIAYSGLFQTGFGVFAGQPYDCARNQSFQTCMDNNHPAITLPTHHLHAWSGQQIDGTDALAHRRIYMQVGAADTTVGPNVMAALQRQLEPFTTDSKDSSSSGSSSNKNNTVFVTLPNAEHTFPTDLKVAGDNPCDNSESPFISDCGYDGAGAVLKWMYGEGLAARNTGALKGELLAFPQSDAFGAPGMGATGYLYVPAACKAGNKVCRLHVAMHGCAQGADAVGLRFVKDTGYNMWADTNDIVMLYPQAVPDSRAFHVYDGKTLSNSNGCWDWLGWYGEDADQKGGIQLSAVVAQVNRIISGHKA